MISSCGLRLSIFTMPPVTGDACWKSRTTPSSSYRRAITDDEIELTVVCVVSDPTTAFPASVLPVCMPKTFCSPSPRVEYKSLRSSRITNNEVVSADVRLGMTTRFVNSPRGDSTPFTCFLSANAKN
jgi:hypothetical protein